MPEGEEKNSFAVESENTFKAERLMIREMSAE
jgi:hypothetical protein